jgi:hypothetical protein
MNEQSFNRDKENNWYYIKLFLLLYRSILFLIFFNIYLI